MTVTMVSAPIPAEQSAAALLAARRKPQSQWRLVTRRLRRSYHALTGAVILSVLVMLAVAAPLIAPDDPTHMVLPDQFQPPSLAHPFGTDEFGRDIFSRVLFGARLSLRVGVLATLLGLSAGTLIGLVAGYFGGW